MSTAASANITILECSAGATVKRLGDSAGSALAEFEQIYRANVDVVMAYGSRCASGCPGRELG